MHDIKSFDTAFFLSSLLLKEQMMTLIKKKKKQKKHLVWDKASPKDIAKQAGVRQS